jgi:murein tripeptide amidase MpaA
MKFNHYFTNEELEEIFERWKEEYSKIIKISSIGVSHENRPIWLLAITNYETGADTEKPAVWIDANIHATEIAGTTTALYTAYFLLDGYGKDEQITQLLDASTYYIVARVNPDGAALSMAPDPRYIRSSVRYYPWDEEEEGLHVKDINGDGKILQMRIRDPNGDWKVSTLDPRLMEKRLPDELGDTYFRLLPEGLLVDFDGYVVKIARPPEGLDFNRNFPFQWRPEGEQSGAGPYPTSEPEIRALVDFIVNHLNINIAITFHTFSRVILRPYSTKPDDDMETDDLWVYKKIGDRGTQLTGYRCVSTFHDFKYHPKEVTTGAFDDWMYDQLGVFAFTIELWDLPAEAGIKERKLIEWWREHPHEEDQQIIKWIDESMVENAYFEWKLFDHPQLGEIEIGGWNAMYTWRNPPPAYIQKEAETQFPYMISLGTMLPHLAVHTLDVSELADKTYYINLVVENLGYLPTYTSAQGKKRQAIRKVRVELDIPEETTLTSGKRRVELGHLEGRSNKFLTISTQGSSPTDNRARAEWVIKSARGTEIGIKILSERAGTVYKKVVLGEIS